MRDWGTPNDNFVSAAQAAASRAKKPRNTGDFRRKTFYLGPSTPPERGDQLRTDLAGIGIDTNRPLGGRSKRRAEMGRRPWRSGESGL